MKRKAIVTNWLDSRGFGFAKDSEDGVTVFVHHRNIKKAKGEYAFLVAGETISYLPAENEKGRFAIAIEKENANATSHRSEIR